jgi:hypothetical protein
VCYSPWEKAEGRRLLGLGVFAISHTKLIDDNVKNDLTQLMTPEVIGA